MKRIKLFIVTLASIMLTISAAAPVTAKAAGDPYLDDNATYLVRIYSGNEGTFADGSTCIRIPVKRGGAVNVWNSIGEVKMKPGKDALNNDVESKYHVICIRQSGRDNIKAPCIAKGSIFNVNSDIDFVVGYGIEGGDVAYTVRYINEDTGAKLADDDIFYGNVGDRPVVAFKFFDGMLPQAYNLTGTLKEDPAANVFTFNYRPGDTTELRTIFVDGPTTINYIDGGTTDGGTLTGDGGGTTGTTDTTGTTGTTGTDNTTAGEGGETTVAAPSVNPEAITYAGGGAPASLIDIDDGTTPLADFGPGFDYDDQVATEVGIASMPNGMKIGLAVLIGLASGGIAFLIVSLVRRKRQKAIDGR